MLSKDQREKTLELLEKEIATSVSYSRIMKINRELSKLCTSNSNEKTLRIALGGNCNTDFLEPSISSSLMLNNLNADFQKLNYDNWMEAALGNSQSVDMWIIWLSSLGASAGGTERREFDFIGIQKAAEAISSKGQRLIIVLPEATQWADDPFSEFGKWRRNAVQKLYDLLDDSIILLSLEHIQRHLGNAKWHALRYWETSKCPCHPDAVTAIGLEIGKTIKQARMRKVKAVIADLDGTLWGGVVGDLGAHNVSLDREGTGRPFIEMQRFLKDLSVMGVPISVCSKNDMTIAEKVFKENDQMLLKLDDIVEFRASWRSKWEVIKEIVSELNLGIDNICFLDDSPHERAEARTFLPTLIVPELPEDPRERVPFLIRSGLYNLPVASSEDLDRSRMYKEEKERKKDLANNVDRNDYLKSLEMTLDCERVTQKNLARVSSLILKTNQFNVTNTRTTENAVFTLCENSETYAYSFSLSDRFGKSGIIGVLLAEIDGTSVIIKEWVLSCRALGRDVESAMLKHICHWASALKLSYVQVIYTETDRNKLLKDCLTGLGFERSEDSSGPWTRKSIAIENLTKNIEIKDISTNDG